jgi:ABC-2 type transport system ATP-binding protein
LIRFTNLNKSYGKRKVIDNLSFTIQANEIFGLLGPNGAGKTTSVNLAVGLLEPDSGSITIGENGSPHSKKDRLQIGVATQALAIYEDLTAEENLLFFGRIYGLSGKVLRDRVDWAFQFVSLENRRKDKPVNYSGGMKRRLNLACGILHDPKILILDEPTVGVDPQSRNAIFEQIKLLNDAGKTIVYITHYMEEAEQLCDRVAIMDDGKIHAMGTVENLIETHGGKPVVKVKMNSVSEVIETDDPIRKLDDLRRTGSIDKFSVEYPNLERVFLKLTGKKLRD